jgi:hypothetical protein
MIALWTWAALAAEPEVRAHADGAVTGELFVAAPADRVRALIDGPVVQGDLSPDVYSVVATPDGPCRQLVTSTRGLWSPLQVRSRWCPSADGFTETLVQSEDFSVYSNQWTVTPANGGSQVALRVHASPNLPVPQSVITENTRRSVGALLVRLAREAVVP